jgi:hypothetical protein
MTEFIKTLRFGSWKEKRKVLKWAGLGSYYKYGTIETPRPGSKVMKKNQLEIIQYESVTTILGIIKIRFRKVYLVSPCFLYRLVYTMKGRLLVMNGGVIRE